MESTGMKKGFIGLMVVGMFILSSCAGSSSYMKPTTERAPLRKEKAVVRFMRPSGYGSPWNINVLDGEKMIGNSVAKSQFDYVADPGRHLFIAAVKNQDYLVADLEGGKVYYVFTNLYPAPFSSFWGGMHVAFEPVNQGSKYWDEVQKYENELILLRPDEMALKVWQDGNAVDAKAMVAAYENDPKKTEYPKLSSGDGR